MRFLVSRGWTVVLALLSFSTLLVALVLVVDLGRRTDDEDWTRAVERLRLRAGMGDAVILHPAGLGQEAHRLVGLPVLCTPGKKLSAVELAEPMGLWVVGSRKLGKGELKLTKAYRKSGRIQYGDIWLQHWWERKVRGGKK